MSKYDFRTKSDGVVTVYRRRLCDKKKSKKGGAVSAPADVLVQWKTDFEKRARQTQLGSGLQVEQPNNEV